MDPEAQQPLIETEGGSSSQAAPAQSEHWTRITARKCYASLSNLGTSLFFGLLTAFGLKTIGQSVAIAVVLLFIGFQVLAYYGFVNFNWSTMAGVVTRRLDLTGDGKFDMKDVAVACKNIGAWTLSWGVPSVAGFAMGFWLGWKVL